MPAVDLVVPGVDIVVPAVDLVVPGVDLVVPAVRYEPSGTSRPARDVSTNRFWHETSPGPLLLPNIRRQ